MAEQLGRLVKGRWLLGDSMVGWLGGIWRLGSGVAGLLGDVLTSWRVAGARCGSFGILWATSGVVGGTLGFPPLERHVGAHTTHGPAARSCRHRFSLFYSMKWQIRQSPLGLFFVKNIKPREDYSTF